MDTKNLGVLIAPPKPTDYVVGGVTSIKIDRVVTNWSTYLPSVESQRNKVTDFLDCLTMSGGHKIEMQLNYLMSTNQMWDEALNFFRNNGFIKDGLFSISKRFNAKMNGTDLLHGNYANAVAENYRVTGFVPESLWPTTDAMTWDEFYSPIPESVIDMAKKSLWFIQMQYQWVDKKNIPEQLKGSPIQPSAEVCAGWDSGQVVQKCSGQPLAHATVIYGQDELGNYLDLDHYPPYLQRLSSDYELPLNVQYYLTLKPVTLRKGMLGKNVFLLQKNLNTLGFNLATDSLFGPQVEACIKTFQVNYKLQSDGVAGPLTLKKINDVLPDNSHAVITRGADNGIETVGSFSIGKFCCKVLEQPWKNNESNISCIAKGTYQCLWSYMNDMKEYHYQLQNVPGRSGIFIHEGNYFGDSAGCILLGNSFGDANNDGQVDVLNSKVTLSTFEQLLNKQPFTLEIK